MGKKLKQLEKIAVERCYKPAIFGTLVECSLHHFADACEYGYGQVSHLHLVDNNGRIHCSLMIGKARVAPLKVMTLHSFTKDVNPFEERIGNSGQ